MNAILRVGIFLIGFLVFSIFTIPVIAQTAGNDESHILISSNKMLYEYTMDGEYIQQVPIPETSGCCGSSRDLVVKYDGSVSVYNGTFTSVLSTYNVDVRQWSEMIAEGWSTVNNVSYGGIATDGNVVFVSDMSTGGDGAPNGIIRFNLEDDNWERFFSGQDYIDLSMGFNNRLYALRNTYGDLDVIDLQTMQLIESLDLGHTSGVRGIAVWEDGTIFAASWDGNIYIYDNQAQLLDTYPTGMGNLCDIDINESGTIIVGSRSGDVAVTDETFSFFTVFDVSGTGPSFVAHIPVDVEIEETFPWQDNFSGNLITDIPWNYAMGYHFTPKVSGLVTKLGGFFNGTKTVRLFNKHTGELLSEATVTASDNWSYEEIEPVSVQEGMVYTVAVYLEGSGGSYRWGVEPFPKDYQYCRIEGTTYAYTGIDPEARPTYTNPNYMFGQADVAFVPVR